MSSRKPAYIIGVILLVFVMSLPRMAMTGMFVWSSFRIGRMPYSSIPSIGPPMEIDHSYNYQAFWKDRFVCMRGNGLDEKGSSQWMYSGTDPETGILTIAFTERRQRLGDIVADTPVIEARSMESPTL